MRLLAALLLAAVAARAQPGAPIDRGAFDLMPGLKPATRYALRAAWDKAAKDYRDIAARMQAIDKAHSRKLSPKLRAEKNLLRARLAKVLDDFRKRLSAAGLDDAQIERLRRMPRGRLREERYNHRVLLETPELTPVQAAFLRQSIAAADAAQLAAELQGEALAKVLGKEQEMERKRLQSMTGQHVRAVEKRFWRLAYYALRPVQMRAARRLFSPRYRAIPQLREQLLQLPGMTPSQGTRVLALFAELESEGAADNAAIRRLRRVQADRSLKGGKRAQVNRELGRAYRRAGARGQAFREALLDLLQPDQRDALRAGPPILGISDRNRPPWEIAHGMVLRAEQAAAVAELRRTGEGMRRRVGGAERKAVGKLRAEIGPDSPQAMTMMMMGRQAGGEILRGYRELGGRLVLEILAPDQLLGWMVGG